MLDDRGARPGALFDAATLVGVPAAVDVAAVVVVDDRHAVLLAVDAPSVPVAADPVEGRGEVDPDMAAAVQVGHRLGQFAPPVDAVQVIAADLLERDELWTVPVDVRSRL